MNKPEGRMLTTNEVASLLGVKPVSVRVWLNEEGHPRFPNAQKFGRDWQIPESDLEGQPRNRKPGRPKKANENGPAEKVSGVPKEYPLEAAEQMRDARPKKATKKRATKGKGGKQ
jgi:hypothetical protein